MGKQGKEKGSVIQLPQWLARLFWCVIPSPNSHAKHIQKSWRTIVLYSRMRAWRSVLRWLRRWAQRSRFPGSRRKHTMRTSLDEVKATQAAAYLLGPTPGSKFDMFRKLVRLMYLADREALARLGFSITRGQHCSLPDGPVISEVNDLLSGSTYKHKYVSGGYWDDHIACTRDDGVQVLKDPGVGRLSASNILILDDIKKQYGSLSDDELGKITHVLPEYDAPDGKTSTKIQAERTLQSGGFTSAQAESIAEEAKARNHFRQLVNQ